MRDTILPPIIKKQLRGRPKKLRRREGFEESVSNGKCVRMSYKGRIMHRGYCKSVEHMINKCPTKPKGYAPPKTGNKRGRTKKKYVDDEVMVEEELQSKEAATGETELMDDLLNQMENEDDIQEQEILNFDDDIEVFKVVQPKMVSKAAMEFVNLHWSFYLFSSDWNVLIFSNRYHNIKLEAWPLRLRNSGGEEVVYNLSFCSTRILCIRSIKRERGTTLGNGYQPPVFYIRANSVGLLAIIPLMVRLRQLLWRLHVLWLPSFLILVVFN
ncbi:uncharacterized protein LOC141717463 isoform X5 [Apium graveolens]|uniref:uncharacterized protein LOC141717463 isoform X5 n=1 Tax=Apium graveolens TaxID=4045 RepID=UPI003D7B9896